jgi:hypothetical protein
MEVGSRAAMTGFAWTKIRPRGSPIAHGREAVRTQSAILDENKPKPSSLLSITLFFIRMRFSSV